MRLRKKTVPTPPNANNCIDVRLIGSEVEPGVFELRGFAPGVDYADLSRGVRMRSIGRRRCDSKFFAAVDERFSRNPEFDCCACGSGDE